MRQAFFVKIKNNPKKYRILFAGSEIIPDVCKAVGNKPGSDKLKYQKT